MNDWDVAATLNPNIFGEAFADAEMASRYSLDGNISQRISVGSLLWFLAENPDYNTYPAAYKNPFEYVFGWLSAEAWTALFTCALFISTLALWNVTRSGANAAKAAAEALPIVERAYLYPEIVSTGAIMQCVQAAYDLNLAVPGANPDTPCDVTTEVWFRVKNYGKTPAILKEIFVGFGMWPIGAQIGLAIPGGILGAGNSTVDLVSEMERGLTRSEAQRVVTYTGHIAFNGQITFDDIWGKERTTEFYFSWEHTTQSMQIRGMRTNVTNKYPPA